MFQKSLRYNVLLFVDTDVAFVVAVMVLTIVRFSSDFDIGPIGQVAHVISINVVVTFDLTNDPTLT